MDSEIIRWIITVAVIPASIIIWSWYTKTFLPDRQKRTDEARLFNRNQDSNRDRADEVAQGSALDLVLKLLEQTMNNLINQNNGHFTTLSIELKEVRDAVNLLIGFVAKDEAAKIALQKTNPDYSTVDKILAAQVPGRSERATSIITQAIEDSPKEKEE